MNVQNVLLTLIVQANWLAITKTFAKIHVSKRNHADHMQLALSLIRCH